MLHFRRRCALLIVVSPLCIGVGCARDLSLVSPCMPEVQTARLGEPYGLAPANIRETPPPITVSDLRRPPAEKPLSLDEAIRIALMNSKVVRVLAGVSAVSSGQTIYNPAISVTAIDQEQARFDPRLEFNNSFSQTDNPQAFFDFTDPAGVRIGGTQVESYNLSAGLAKTNVLGGTATLSVSDTLSRFEPGVFALNPENRHAITFRYDQPLLQGAGPTANLAPVVIARVNADRSYFQFKGAVQEMVRGVIEAYWALVFARTDVWAREQQVKQATFAYERADASLRAGRGDAADVAQARAALANFKAALVAAQANEIQREAALRNILGLPPTDGAKLVPVTPPTNQRLRIDWDALVRLAEERRPDIVELKLIIEADTQLLAQANNQALPKVDAVMLYRWNGLEGTTPAGTHISSEGGQFSDWVLGVNFSLPLGLRRERAVLRQQELILARDWANLDQGLHAAVHELATSTRNLAQFYEQYRAFVEAREAARRNLEVQSFRYFKAGGVGKLQPVNFLNVLQAIADWGNAVSAEAQALAQYNSELANLERLSGTILETHGIFFYQERFRAIGPLGRLARPECYPASFSPTPNAQRYPTMSRPAENFFNLEDPLPKK